MSNSIPYNETEIYQHILRDISHTFGGMLGCIGGYTEIFELTEQGKLIRANVGNLLGNAQSYRPTYQSKHDSIIRLIESVPSISLDDNSVLLEEVEQSTQKFVIWFDLLDKVATEYRDNQTLNKALIQQMTQNVDDLRILRNHLINQLYINTL